MGQRRAKRDTTRNLGVCAIIQRVGGYGWDRNHVHGAMGSPDTSNWHMQSPFPESGAQRWKTSGVGVPWDQRGTGRARKRRASEGTALCPSSGKAASRHGAVPPPTQPGLCFCACHNSQGPLWLNQHPLRTVWTGSYQGKQDFKMLPSRALRKDSSFSPLKWRQTCWGLNKPHPERKW